VGKAVFKLGEDAYVEWSSVVDAPVSDVMTKNEALGAGIALARLERADALGHSWTDMDKVQSPEDLVAGNRAGPRESCLSLAAILRVYAPVAGEEDREISVDDIEPYTTSWAVPEGHEDWGKVYWVPWKPGEGPERLTEETDFDAMVEDPALSWDKKATESVVAEAEELLRGS